MADRFLGKKLGMVLLVLVILAGCTQQRGTALGSPSPTNQNTAQANRRISLNTFSSPTPTPLSAPACGHDNGANLGNIADPNCSCNAYFLTCQNHRCVSIRQGTAPQGDTSMNCDTIGMVGGTRITDLWCASSGLTGDGSGLYCVGKPVIYLYPPGPTLVTVQVKTSGAIVVSDPVYPKEGWKDVLAYPDGSLFYSGQSYKELFYESNVSSIPQPKTGMVIPKAYLKPTLTLVLTRLGLTEPERAEFLDFWLPKLETLPAPAVFFSLVDPATKETIDSITITPKPDIFINFLVYFAPITTSYTGKALTLPAQPFRVGFTAVEWGGTIGPAYGTHPSPQSSPFVLF